jgi:chemotaxis signal transduction protein
MERRVAESGHETYLVLFSVGGVQFAVEAYSIEHIAESNWAPEPTDDQEDQGDTQDESGQEPQAHTIDMGDLLDLPSSSGGRTIVVSTPMGNRGFVVDMISKEEITQHSIVPVPPLLKEFMKPVAVSGFYVTEDKVVGVLDFKRLAEVAFKEREKP